MKTENMEDKFGCQLQVVYDSAGPLTPFDKIRNFSKRLFSALRRRIRRVVSRDPGCPSGLDPANSSDPGTPAIEGSPTLQAGDLVEIRSYQEILTTLDGKGCCEGLEFMPGMDRYAGQRFTVLKNVRTMFDERAWKMVRLKHTVILKDVICDAHGMYDKEGCDRQRCPVRFLHPGVYALTSLFC